MQKALYVHLSCTKLGEGETLWCVGHLAAEGLNLSKDMLVRLIREPELDVGNDSKGFKYFMTCKSRVRGKEGYMH